MCQFRNGGGGVCGADLGDDLEADVVKKGSRSVKRLNYDEYSNLDHDVAVPEPLQHHHKHFFFFLQQYILLVWLMGEENNVTIQRPPHLHLQLRRRSLLKLRKSHRNTRKHPLLLRPTLRETKPAFPLRAQLSQLPASSTSSNPRPAAFLTLHRDFRFLAYS